jgi:hypothetical protein
MPRILVGAADGLHVLGDGAEPAVELAGRHVTALGRDDDEVVAILDAREVRRTEGGSWSPGGVSSANRDLTCVASTDAGILVGIAGAHLARLTDRGLERIGGFDEIEGRDEWYTPWGGPPDTRSISEMEESVYVNVHVGGIPVTRDGAATWRPTIDIDADVHRVWAGPPGVFAACAQGLGVSEDRGRTWTMRSDGLHARYSRAVTVCGDTVLMSTSVGPRGGRAAVYRSSPKGGAFERCTVGLPDWFDGNIDSSWLDAMPELAAFAAVDGRVFASRDEGASWDQVASGIPSPSCVLVMP